MLQEKSMYIELLVAVLLIGLIVALIGRGSKKQNGNREAPDDISADFLNSCSWESVVAMAVVYSRVDMMLIRAMLDSCGIKSLAFFENMNELYPGVGIDRFNDMILLLRRDDIEEAILVIDEYNSRKQGNYRYSFGSAVRNAVELLCCGRFVATNQNTRNAVLLRSARPNDLREYQ